jgi:hypothetical protein
VKGEQMKRVVVLCGILVWTVTAGAFAETRLVPDPYPTIQAAIDAAGDGDLIQVAPGTYHENILVAGRDVTLQSSDANDPNVTAITVLEGNGVDPVVRLQNSTERCILAGLTIRGGGTGIWCSGGQPAVRGCHIVENLGPGIELLAGAKPTIGNCIIAANGGLGIKMPSLVQLRGQTPISPILVNCTIAQNTEGGISGGTPAVRNSILYFNGPQQAGQQISVQGSQVTYSCVQGGFTGTGSINVDPLFARLGPDGDCHLQSRAGCWDPNSIAWVRDGRTSPCIDAGNPADAVGAECVSNGGRIDMGAYGGTVQASRSPAVQFAETGQPLNPLAGRGVVLADFNGDGVLDAFVANQDSRDGRGHRVYCGLEHGLFSDSGQVLLDPAGWADRPAIGDIDGDGRQEVITGRTAWLNDGQGYFTVSTDRFTDSDQMALFRIRLADLNGDGRPDVVATIWNGTTGNGHFRVYLNDGQGRFRDTGSRLGGGMIAPITLGDLDGNGTIDAVTTGWRANTVIPGASDYCPNRVWLNDGNSRFTDSGQVLDEGAHHLHTTAIADIDGDGHLDLIIGMTDAPWAKVYLNDGQGRFSPVQTFGTAWVESLACGDLDGDGLVDVFVGCGAGSPNQVWLNDGRGRLRDSGVRLTAVHSADVALGDLDADGDLDAFVVGFGGTSEILGSPAQMWLNTTPQRPAVYRSLAAD